MNPTTDVLEKRVAALEGGVGALATSSGQAAQTLAILNIANAGDEIVSTTSLYGGTYNQFEHTLPKLGIKVHFCEPTPEGVRKAITPQTKLVYSETIGNPDLLTLDIQAVADEAHDAGVPLMIDNTLPTPYLVRPIEHGADIVVHSLTKFIGGHGTSIGGIIVDGGSFDWKASGKFPGFTEPDPSYHGLVFTDVFTVENFGANIAYIIKARVQGQRDIGASISPFNAFLFLQGIETLPLRMERHSQNAMVVARFLSEHPKVNWVNYPGLPGTRPMSAPPNTTAMVSSAPSSASASRAAWRPGGASSRTLKLFSHLANVGDAKSLVIHPATTTHSQLDENAQAATGRHPGLRPPLGRARNGERPHRRPRPGARQVRRSRPAFLVLRSKAPLHHHEKGAGVSVVIGRRLSLMSTPRVVVVPAPEAAISAPSVATGCGARSPSATIHSPRNHCRCQGIATRFLCVVKSTR